MLNEDRLREIEKYEEAGIDIVVISSSGSLDCSTHGASSSEFCDHCSAFKLLPDPDPYEWFRSGDIKAVCLEVNGLIAGALEPSELTNISKPLFCPKLGRELREEEKLEAAKYLKWAKERMK